MTQPYYQDDAVTIYHGDCREVTEWLTADVLVTDPPYGMAYISNSGASPTAPIAGDDAVDLRDWMLEAWMTRPAIVFGTWRAPRPTGVSQLLVWDKGECPGMGDLSIPWGPAHEEVYVLGKGFTGRRTPNVIRCQTVPVAHRLGHPTEKPVPLLRELIGKCPSGVIADPFAGSGTTLRAAKDLGRKAIGVEVDERYCDMAARRMGQEVLPL